MDNNFLNEVFGMMNGEFNVQDYFKEIGSLVKNMTQDKFINNFNSAVNQYKKKSIKESSKEINLLNAMKPFIEEKRRTEIDRVAHLISDYKTIEKIMHDYNSARLNKTMQNPSDSDTAKSINIRPNNVRPISAKQNNINSNKSDNNITISSGDLIIDGNAVYEIEPNCEKKISKKESENNNYLPIIFLMILSNKRN